MSKVGRQSYPALSFAHTQMFGVEDSGDIGSRAVSVADAGGRVMCPTWSLVPSEAPHALHTCKGQPVAAAGHGSTPGCPAWPGSSPGRARGWPGSCPGLLWGIAPACARAVPTVPTEQPVPGDGHSVVMGTLWCLALKGRAAHPGEDVGGAQHWSSITALLVSLHTWRRARAALPCPVCPAAPRAAWQSCGCLKALLQLVFLCPGHRAGSLHSVLLSPGCRGCHLSWQSALPVTSLESVTPGELRWFSPWWFSL